MFPRRAARFYSTRTRERLRGRRAAPVPGSFNLSPFSGAMPLTTRRIASLFRAPSPPARRFRPSRVFYAVESARILSANSRPLCGLALRPVALRTDSR